MFLDKDTDFEQRGFLRQQECGEPFGFTVSVDVKCGILIKTNYTHWVWNKTETAQGMVLYVITEL